MKKLVIALSAVSVLTLGGCIGDNNYGGRGERPGYYSQQPAQGYDAYRDYRDEPKYRERGLGRNDRIYRGSDGRYYCKRNDGTTGLIVGAVGGGVLGNLIAPGGSGTIGTLLGAAGGALLGRSIDRNQVKCK